LAGPLAPAPSRKKFAAQAKEQLERQGSIVDLTKLLHGVNGLRSVRVGAVSGSATVDYLTRERIAHRGFADPQEGLRMCRQAASMRSCTTSRC
jgi:hypothetical protein